MRRTVRDASRSTGAGDEPAPMPAASGTPSPLASSWTLLADVLLERAVIAERASRPREPDTGISAPPSPSQSLDERFASARAAFEACLDEPTPFGMLAHNAGLTVEEAEVLALAVSIEADPRRQLLIASVQHDRASQRLTLSGLATVLAGEHTGVRAVGPDAALRRAALVDVIADGAWANHVVSVHPSVMWALAGDGSSDPSLPPGTELITSTGREGPEREATGSDAAMSEPDDAGRLVVVTGPDRVRRLQAAIRQAVGDRFVVTRQPADEDEWAAVVREATIVGAGVVVELDDELPTAGRRWIERAVHLVWALTSPVELPIEQMPDRPWLDRHAHSTEPTDREWTAALGDVARTHQLTATQLRLVARARTATGGDIDAAVRRLAGGRIDRLARRIRPTRTWDDIVLSADRMERLHEIVARHRHSETVYGDWGFSPVPSRGLVALFSGVSGTGKTLAAEIIAGELGLDLFKLDLSSIVSKYIGETEKNLSQMFDAAGAGNVVLFFDEADALFGKRSEVRDAHDRYANIEVSFLLQRLETYDGVVVLATNFERNIDDAFLRRIQSRVEFALPDIAERKAIWEHNLPIDAPVSDDVDTDFLARQFEISGGSIRNAAVQAAFLAAADGTTIDMGCVVRAVGREYQKLGRLITTDDFGDHYRLVIADDG